MFKIGQQVVCVKTHSQGVVKEGEVFTVNGIRTCANCNIVDLDVGIKLFSIMACSCGALTQTNVWWIHNYLFRPLDELFNEEISELMQEINERVPFEV